MVRHSLWRLRYAIAIVVCIVAVRFTGSWSWLAYVLIVVAVVGTLGVDVASEIRRRRSNSSK